MKLSRVLLLSIAFPFLLVSCSKDPDVTDDEILDFLGEKYQYPYYGIRSSTDEPLTISKNTLECVSLISDIDKEVYKDAPKEIVGMIKTECRKMFRDRIAIKTVKTKKIKLEHFENKTFAERIKLIAKQADKKSEAFIREQREREEQEQQERQAKLQSEIDALKKKSIDIVSSLDERFQKINTICESLKEEKQLVKYDYMVNIPSICKENEQEKIRILANENVKKANELTVPQKKRGVIDQIYFHFGDADSEQLDRYQLNLEEQLKEAKTKARK